MRLDVQSYVEKEKEKLKDNFRSIENPKLMIFSSDANGATKSYLKNKIKVGGELGVEVIVKNIKSTRELLDEIYYCKHNTIPTILQLPLDNKFLSTAYNASAELCDVDGFFRYDEIYNSHVFDNILPATPKGILSYLKHWCYEKDEDLSKLSVCIFGRGELVGKPLATMMLPHIGSLSIVTSKTDESTVRKYVEASNILVLCTGKDDLKYIGDYLSDNGVNKLIVDTGVFLGNDNKLHGETYPFLDKIEKFNIDYTPVPKGVGILTTLNLFKNVLMWYVEKDKANLDMIKEI